MQTRLTSRGWRKRIAKIEGTLTGTLRVLQRRVHLRYIELREVMIHGVNVNSPPHGPALSNG